jgi:hypothetical protein
MFHPIRVQKSLLITAYPLTVGFERDAFAFGCGGDPDQPLGFTRHRAFLEKCDARQYLTFEVTRCAYIHGQFKSENTQFSTGF